jgi:hypothetical protein
MTGNPPYSCSSTAPPTVFEEFSEGFGTRDLVVAADLLASFGARPSTCRRSVQ